MLYVWHKMVFTQTSIHCADIATLSGNIRLKKGLLTPRKSGFQKPSSEVCGRVLTVSQVELGCSGLTQKYLGQKMNRHYMWKVHITEKSRNRVSPWGRLKPPNMNFWRYPKLSLVVSDSRKNIWVRKITCTICKKCTLLKNRDLTFFGF